jgi:hypothetical protein
MERFCALMSKKLEYGQGSAPDLSNEERERRRLAVMSVVDAMLAATLPLRVFAAFALDTSGIWAWGKAVRRAPKNLLAKDAAARERGVDLDDPIRRTRSSQRTRPTQNRTRNP